MYAMEKTRQSVLGHEARVVSGSGSYLRPPGHAGDEETNERIVVDEGVSTNFADFLKFF